VYHFSQLKLLLKGCRRSKLSSSLSRLLLDRRLDKHQTVIFLNLPLLELNKSSINQSINQSIGMSDQEESLQWGDGSSSISGDEFSFDCFGNGGLEDHSSKSSKPSRKMSLVGTDEDALLFRHEEILTTDKNDDKDIQYKECFTFTQEEDAPDFSMISEHHDSIITKDVDYVYFDAIRQEQQVGGAGSNSSTSTGTNTTRTRSSEPIYYQRDNRKRVVRFLEDEDLDDSLDYAGGGGLLVAGGTGLVMAGAGTVAAGILPLPDDENEGSARSFNFVDDQQCPSDGSIDMLDVFGEGSSGSSSNKDMDASGATSLMEKGEDEDDDGTSSIDEDEEKEKQIRRTLMISVLGMGFLGLIGFGGKKLMSALNRGGSNDDDIAATGTDMIGEAADTATQAHEMAHLGGHIAGEGVATSSSSQAGAAAAHASFNASANASSSNGFMMAGVGNNPAAAMNGAQYVYIYIYIYSIDDATLSLSSTFSLFACSFLFIYLL
jgi:hypothetical protein